MTFDPAAFRALVASRPQVTYDELDTSPKHLATRFTDDLDRMLEEGWERDGIRLPILRPPLPWNSFGRSFSHRLHAWEPITFLLKGSCISEDACRRARYLEASFVFAWDWLLTFQRPVLQLDPMELLSARRPDEQGLEWYDMAVGQRIYRLAFLLDAMCRQQDVDLDIISFLYDSLQFHHRLLCQDAFFNEHSNHGLYQALGQLAAARRFEDIDLSARPYAELAARRLQKLIEHHFTADSVHKEHSPGYHYMILGTLVGARQTGLIKEAHLLRRINDMEARLTWMITPALRLVTFGDTDPRDVKRSVALASRFKSPRLQGLLSNFAIGQEPKIGVQPFPDAGYAFARLYGPDVPRLPENASYLAQIAAFHSRVHKHADHLAFVWHDRRHEILVDVGRYAYAGRTEAGSELAKQGFWYSDPKRIYCESTRSHNTVEIDYASFPRAKVRPFGSALVYAEEQYGCAVTYCEATHFRRIRHNRLLIMGPNRFLLVFDWLYDRTGTHHDYRQFFHFAPDWQVTNSASGITASCLASSNALHVSATTLSDGSISSVVRGQEEPELLGWYSDRANSLIPTSCFHVHERSNRPVRLVTLFVFGDELTVDRDRTRFNQRLTAGKVAWTDEAGSTFIEIHDRKIANLERKST